MEQNQQSKMYKLTEEQRTALLSYLQGKPYIEVVAGINMLKSLEEITISGEVIGEVIKNESK